jgi:hypothetical protein
VHETIGKYRPCSVNHISNGLTWIEIDWNKF